jgi:RNA polymerase sigma-70 factor (ECF subfamily)
VQAAGEAPDPAERAAAAESVSLALLVVLENLSASERVAFVLHDVFGYEFEHVAEVLGTTAQSARQHASRARRAVEARRPRYPASPQQQREVVDAFVAAGRGGDIGALVELLDPDVVLTTDGGGITRAARKPIVGAERVARAMLGFARVSGGTVEPVDVNGLPGLLGRAGDGTLAVVGFTLDGGRIVTIDIQRNPTKLKGVRPV